ncbi:MAG TPA: dihydrolipoyl dehydrogenase, partial [Candidatus Woesearchaeota archaeon]|nr:dihydrolipoyl dehydrogenase [Candidatus Woesearchaeota archaeon]
AIGDVSIGPMLAHKASSQGKFVAEAIAGNKDKYENVVVPAVIFTDPEIATVGLNEREAKNKGIKTKMGKFPFSLSSRAMTKNETEGFVKVIANEKNSKIIGVQIIGSDASDLTSEASLAIKMGATLDDVALTIHPHPTLSESLMEAAEATMGKAIHILNPK